MSKVEMDAAPRLASLAPTASMIDFAAINGAQGLDRIAVEWRTLIEQIPSARFFQFPEWHLANLASMEPRPERVWFVSARQQGRLVGVLPLRQESRRIRGIGVRTLCTITHPHATLADFAFACTSDGAELFRQFNRWIRQQRTIVWDELALEGIPDESAVAFAVRATPPMLLVEELQGESAYLPTRGGAEQALAAVSGSFKRNLRRLARRAEQSAPLTYRVVRDDSGLDDALEKFLDIEQSGWKGSDGTGSAIRLDPARQAFYQGLRRQFSRLGACRINLLEHGCHAVAAQFCLMSGQTLNILKIGFLESHAAFAPGNLVMESTIEHCCSEPSIRAMSFVTNPPWAHLWKPQMEPVRRYRTYNGSARGLMLYGLLTAKRWYEARKLPQGLSEAAPGATNEQDQG
jgi:CelD/BcsL family acetyltransferase involved in cellulose biosynthesis